MIDLVLDGLAAFRITRLIVEDVILERPREKVVEALTVAGYEKAAYGLTCPWCVSIYVAAGVVTLRRYAPKWWAPVATALALSAAAGLLSGHEEG